MIFRSGTPLYTEKMKIYIVDDASFIRIICRYHLTKAGYEVIGEAHDGEVAMQEIQSLQPDCVIMDLALPNKNGTEIMRGLQDIFPQIHFLVITALDRDIFDQSSADIRVSGFLTKPFEGSELLDQVRRIEKQLEKVRHG
jgi:two-component system chemotaxis response regulator CheY